MTDPCRVTLALTDEGDGAPMRLSVCPAELMIPLRRSGRGHTPALRVAPGDSVASGDCLADSPQAAVHAPCAGTVIGIAGGIRLRCTEGAPWPFSVAAPLKIAAGEDFGAFLAKAGMVGMGGGQFPASIKFAAARGVGTLVVNGVECEPGTTIDTELLRHDGELIRIGAQALAQAVGATRTVLALGTAPQAKSLAAAYPWQTLVMPAGYPAGAERLIMQALTGRRLPAGALPARLGVLIHNVATLRAIGRAVRDGVPCIERPLSVLHPALGKRRNVIVPIGMAAADVLAACQWPLEKGVTVISGGVMMGHRLDSASAPVTRGTTSLTVLPAGTPAPRVAPCLRCGACYDACPLGLHPIDLAERVSEGVRPFPPTTRAQLDDCFLCGVCSAVCPSYIPIAAILREARHG